MERTTILETANRIVSKDRNSQYDAPERNFERIAARWNLTLENAFARGYVTPYEVALLMIDVKMARITSSPDVADHWVDIAGYAACGGEVAIERKEPPKRIIEELDLEGDTENGR